jgi:hypothetical protein
MPHPRKLAFRLEWMSGSLILCPVDLRGRAGCI